MANLDPQVQIKLIEISKEWAEKTIRNPSPENIPKVYPEQFDHVYKRLAKTVSEK